RDDIVPGVSGLAEQNNCRVVFCRLLGLGCPKQAIAKVATLLIAIATDGSLWVADFNNSRVQHLTVDAKLIEQFGGEGNGPGQFAGIYGIPGGITLSADGSLWVLDSGNNRI
ncbi:MAG: hypothetical protein HOP02_05955, partial [Methylococcaceae bacterium]|nr:hypothetical protein [Methylococcaceae bacterium]